MFLKLYCAIDEICFWLCSLTIDRYKAWRRLRGKTTKEAIAILREEVSKLPGGREAYIMTECCDKLEEASKDKEATP